VDKDEFDVIKTPVWAAPREDGAKILTMPNIPAPLHQLAPRTVMGATAWNHMRKKCYFDAGYKCQACGKELGRGECDAHELYTINYITGESRFERCVCLCHTCHRLGIHSGRALTMFKKGNPLMTKRMILEGAENLFKLLHEWNKAHPNSIPLRAYGTFVDYAKWPPIENEMKALIKKYDVKFYEEDKSRVAEWSKWSLLYGKTRYRTPYKNQEEWALAMDRNDRHNHNVAIKQKTEADLEIERILGLT